MTHYFLTFTIGYLHKLYLVYPIFLFINLLMSNRKLTYYMIKKIENAIISAVNPIKTKNVNWEGYEKEYEKNNSLNVYQKRLQNASLYYFRELNPNSKITDNEYKHMFSDYLNNAKLKNTKKEYLRSLPWWRVNRLFFRNYW